MGRTTENKKDSTLIVRISPELKGNLEKQAARADKKLSDYVRECLEENNESRNNVIQAKGINESTLREIQDMCYASGIPTEKFFDRICELFKDGMICIEGVQIHTKGKYSTSMLEDVCHRANVDPQEMIDKLTKSLMRG